MRDTIWSVLAIVLLAGQAFMFHEWAKGTPPPFALTLQGEIPSELGGHLVVLNAKSEAVLVGDPKLEEGKAPLFALADRGDLRLQWFAAEGDPEPLLTKRFLVDEEQVTVDLTAADLLSGGIYTLQLTDASGETLPIASRSSSVVSATPATAAEQISRAWKDPKLPLEDIIIPLAQTSTSRVLAIRYPEDRTLLAGARLRHLITGAEGAKAVVHQAFSSREALTAQAGEGLPVTFQVPTAFLEIPGLVQEGSRIEFQAQGGEWLASWPLVAPAEAAQAPAFSSPEARSVETLEGSTFATLAGRLPPGSAYRARLLLARRAADGTPRGFVVLPTETFEPADAREGRLTVSFPIPDFGTLTAPASAAGVRIARSERATSHQWKLSHPAHPDYRPQPDAGPDGQLSWPLLPHGTYAYQLPGTSLVQGATGEVRITEEAATLR